MRAQWSLPIHPFWSFAAAALLSGIFVAVAYPNLDTLAWEYDEGTFMVQARSISRGLRPFVDFAHHQPPLHLYLLALSGKLFGQTVFGYRTLSLLSLSASGILVFCLARPFVGPLPALVAQAVFLFSPSQVHALQAVAESPMLLFSLLGVVLLFVGTGRSSAYASGVTFVVALLIKSTCLVVVLAACLSLVYARAWRRLVDLAVSGIVTAAAGLAWTIHQSDGVFLDILRLQLGRLGTRNVDAFRLFSTETVLGSFCRSLGISTPAQWAWYSLRNYYFTQETYLTMSLLGLAGLGLPIWVYLCKGKWRALQAFAVLWPASYLLLNFVVLDLVSAKYFVPFPAIWAFSLAAVVWLAQRYLPLVVVVAVGVAVCAALVGHFVRALDMERDVGYYQRAASIAREHPAVVSFSPMFFAATGTEPGCGFASPALTYGAIGAALLGSSSHTGSFWFPDERLIDCLRANKDTFVLVDSWFFFFLTNPRPLREYLRGEGNAQLLFFSPRERERLELE